MPYRRAGEIWISEMRYCFWATPSAIALSGIVACGGTGSIRREHSAQVFMRGTGRTREAQAGPIESDQSLSDAIRCNEMQSDAMRCNQIRFESQFLAFWLPGFLGCWIAGLPKRESSSPSAFMKLKSRQAYVLALHQASCVQAGCLASR